MEKKIERRRYPRIKDKDVAIKLSSEGFNTITQSLDISASGIYCKIDRHIPLMTRLQIVLTLPVRRGRAVSTTLKVDGVVVREHAVKKDGKVEYYDVAIFFNTLLPKERKVLVQYINQKAERLSRS